MGEGGERRTQKAVRRKDTGDLTSLCKGEPDKWQIRERRRRGGMEVTNCFAGRQDKSLDLRQQGCSVHKQKRIRGEEKEKFSRGNVRGKREE